MCAWDIFPVSIKRIYHFLNCFPFQNQLELLEKVHVSGSLTVLITANRKNNDHSISEKHYTNYFKCINNNHQNLNTFLNILCGILEYSLECYQIKQLPTFQNMIEWRLNKKSIRNYVHLVTVVNKLLQNIYHFSYGIE